MADHFINFIYGDADRDCTDLFPILRVDRDERSLRFPERARGCADMDMPF